MNILVPYLARWNSLNRSRYYQIFDQLSRGGHNVYLVQPPMMNSADTGFVEADTPADSKVRLLEADLSPVFWNAPMPFNKIMKKGAYCLKMNADAGMLIDAYEIDAVLFYNMALMPLSRRSDVVTIYDLGDDHLDLLAHELGRFSNRLIMGFAEKLLLKTLHNCDCVFSVSHFLTEKYYPQSFYLPNGVDIDAVRPGCGRELKKELKGPVIGFIGSLEYFIDFDRIIEAAAVLKDCTFVIAGGGREFERIKKEKDRLKLDNLVLTGGLPHPEILKRIDSFDICLNPFKPSPLTHGACPIKLFEYMAFKKPVISSRIREVERIGRDFVYFADSTSEIVSCIQGILSRPDEACRRAEKSHEVLLSTYTWPRIADTFASVVEESLVKKRAC